jgi:hypothetical protein
MNWTSETLRAKQIYSVLLLGSLLCTPIWAQESEAELKRQLARVQQELKSEESALQQQRELDAQRKQILMQRLQQADQQIADLKRTQGQIQSEIRQAQANNNGLKATASGWEQRKTTTAREVAQVVLRVEKALVQDFPLQVEERTERLKALRQQLDQGALGPEEGMNRLWSILLERLRQGYQAEAWPGSFALAQGGSASGTYFRIGTVWQGFASEDGREVHFLTRTDSGYSWTAVPAQSLEMRAALKQAAQVATGKLPPQMARIPVQVKVTTSKSASPVSQPGASK